MKFVLSIAAACALAGLCPADAHASASITPQQFGATCSGGDHDDTAQLTAMIKAAAASGKTMEIKQGTCMASSLTVPGDGVTLMIDQGAKLMQLASAAHTTFLTMVGNNQTLRGPGAIDGNKSVDHDFSFCVNLYGDNKTVEDITVQNCNGGGIQFSNTQNFHGQQITVVNTGYSGMKGVAAKGPMNGLRLSDISVDRRKQGPGVTGNGIQVRGTASAGIKNAQLSNLRARYTEPSNDNNPIELWYFQNSTLQNFVTYGGSIGISITAQTDSTVSDMTSYNAGLYGVELGGNTRTKATNLIVHGGQHAAQGVNLTGSATDEDVSNVTVDGVRINGVKVSNGSGVNLSNINVDISSAKSGAAIRFDKSTKWSLKQFAIKGVAGKSGVHAIFLNNSQDGTITGGKVTNFERGIYFSSSTAKLDNVSVSGNAFKGVSFPIYLGFSKAGGLGPNVRISGNSGVPQQTR